ncbi:MAG TPA: hypothetical protein ENK74_00060 [Nitratifractor sp.]|jgi:WD40 repeat protein|nr:hypothetical protein [Nitratifractor sp.]
MKKLLLFIHLSISIVFAKEIAPFMQIDAKAIVKDIALGAPNELVIGTTASELKVFNYKAKKFVKSIKVPQIKDFMGDTIDTRISNVDYYHGKYLLLSDSGIGGYTDLRLNENNQTQDIFTEKDKLPLVKAKFIDDSHILLGFLSNEAALYDYKSHKFLYRIQLSESKFSDFALNIKRDLAAFSCESGEITILNPKSGKILKRLNSLNVDNVYKVDIKKNYVVCAGQDRRASWYNIDSGKGDYIQAKFLIYATALSPDANRAAFALDENSNITIVNLPTKSKTAILKGQKGTLNSIIFLDNNRLFSASDDNIVIMWKLDK